AARGRTAQGRRLSGDTLEFPAHFFQGRCRSKAMSELGAADNAGSGRRSGAKNSSLLQRHAAFIYFALTFGLSWTAALLVAAPYLVRGETVPKFAGLMMFPVMLLGPAVAGGALTAIADGQPRLRDLYSRIFRVRFPARWLLTLLIAPSLVLGV